MLKELVPKAMLDGVPPPGAQIHWLAANGAELVILSLPLRLPELERRCSRAERDVLIGILASKSDAEIAKQRGTSPRTIANQARALMRRYGVSSRRELVAQLMASASSD
jgi:DNA-binding CsgD family transcriptional regulator